MRVSKNWSGINDTVRLREVSDLEDVRFMEVSLYFDLTYSLFPFFV